MLANLLFPRKWAGHVKSTLQQGNLCWNIYSNAPRHIRTKYQCFYRKNGASSSIGAPFPGFLRGITSATRRGKKLDIPRVKLSRLPGRLRCRILLLSR